MTPRYFNSVRDTDKITDFSDGGSPRKRAENADLVERQDLFL